MITKKNQEMKQGDAGKIPPRYRDLFSFDNVEVRILEKHLKSAEPVPKYSLESANGVVNIDAHHRIGIALRSKDNNKPVFLNMQVYGELPTKEFTVFEKLIIKEKTVFDRKLVRDKVEIKERFFLMIDLLGITSAPKKSKLQFHNAKGISIPGTNYFVRVVEDFGIPDECII